MMSRGGARLMLLVPGALCLFAGLDAALLLLGLPAPVETARLPVVHGPLLVFGFIGTVIALERAVAVRRLWAFASPAVLGLAASCSSRLCRSWSARVCSQPEPRCCCSSTG